MIRTNRFAWAGSSTDDSAAVCDCRRRSAGRHRGFRWRNLRGSCGRRAWGWCSIAIRQARRKRCCAAPAVLREVFAGSGAAAHPERPRGPRRPRQLRRRARRPGRSLARRRPPRRRPANASSASPPTPRAGPRSRTNLRRLHRHRPRLRHRQPSSIPTPSSASKASAAPARSPPSRWSRSAASPAPTRAA